MKKQQISRNKNRLSDLESWFLLCGRLLGMDRKTSVCVFILQQINLFFRSFPFKASAVHRNKRQLPRHQ